jgi:GNAT superfamily N-acetyltransferase
MYQSKRTNSSDSHFLLLVKDLDLDLLNRYGNEDQSFYDQFNSLASIKHVIIINEDNTPIACGAIKIFDPTTMEVKRMYVVPAYRNKGLASLVLSELERWAKELGFIKCILETGNKQPEAIRLYSKNGYYRIENYGDYVDDMGSVCFGKLLADKF